LFKFMTVDLSARQIHARDPLPADGRSLRLDCDVAIVGGGVVGMTLACALGQAGLRVMTIDAQTMEAAANRQNVYAISLLSGRIFAGLGVWEQIRPRISTFTQIVLSDGDRARRVTLKPEDLGVVSELDHLGYVAEHQPILEALHTEFGDRETMTLLAPAQVCDVIHHADHTELTLEVAGQTRTITTQLVVAADGARSQLRQTAGIRQTGWKYWQSCVTFKVKARQPQQSHQNIAYEKFRTQGPFAILPLTGDRCNVVWTLPHAEAQAMMALDEAAFNRAMREHFGDHMGDLDIISLRRLFPVQLMQSQRYVAPRFALAGDAAHCCHPVGGQGVNLGIRDAAALAEVLGDAFRAGEDLGSVAVLQRYERWRRWENWVVLGFTDSLDRLFSNEIGPLVWVRQLGFWGLTTIAPIRRLALQLMTGGLGRQPKISISR
jgi:2-octaprenyl-6-methoxyphenol hydroxylase